MASILKKHHLLSSLLRVLNKKNTEEIILQKVKDNIMLSMTELFHEVKSEPLIRTNNFLRRTFKKHLFSQ